METVLLIPRRHGALRKMGPVQEGSLRNSFLCRGELRDRVLRAVIDKDWYRSKAVWGSKIN